MNLLAFDLGVTNRQRGIASVRSLVEKFNPNHVPSGEHGGQFTSGGGSSATQAEWESNLSEKDKSLIYEWTEGGYKEYQDTILNPSKHTEDEIGRAKDLEAVFSSAPAYEGTVYRGLFSVANEASIEGIPLKKGQTFELNAPISSSKKKSVAREFSFGMTTPGKLAVTIEFRTKRGAADISKIGSEGNAEQEEVVLKRGAKFAVVDAGRAKRAENVDGEAIYHRHIVVEEV